MRYPQPLQPRPYILCAFCLTPHRARATIPAILLLRPLALSLRVATGGSTCNIFRAGLFNASIRPAPPAATGFALTFPALMPAWNSARPVAVRYKRFLRPSARASACARGLSPPARRCAHGRDKSSRILALREIHTSAYLARYSRFRHNPRMSFVGPSSG